MSLKFLSLFFVGLFVYCDIITLTPDNYDNILSLGNVFVKYYSPTCPHCKNVAPTFIQLEKDFAKYSDKVSFAELDCVEHGGLCGKAGVGGYPTLKYYKSETNVDDYEGDRSIENFSEYISGKIGVFYRPKPSNVKILTPADFDSYVYDLTKNVFVAFTASWCGHCKAFKPHLEQAALSYKEGDNVTFVNFDADFYKDFGEYYGVHSFPTIKFFPANPSAIGTANEDLALENRLKKGGVDVVAYNGERTANGVISFINSRCGTYRSLGGGIEPFAGLENNMVDHIKNLVTSIVDSSSLITLGNAKETALLAAEKIKNNYVKSQYTRYINRISDEGIKGLTFAQTETDRLNDILVNNKLSDRNEVEFVVRKNVLGLFLTNTTSSSAV